MNRDRGYPVELRIIDRYYRVVAVRVESVSSRAEMVRRAEAFHAAYARQHPGTFVASWALLGC